MSKDVNDIGSSKNKKPEESVVLPLARKLSKMHDIVIGLMINKIEFGIDIYAKSQV